jgi:mRNA interferase RelE/StbE
MKIIYLKSFDKDIDKLSNQRIKLSLFNVINDIKKSNVKSDIPNLKKLTKGKIYYRIRISNYRLGVSITDDVVSLIRFLHRKDLYNKFP